MGGLIRIRVKVRLAMPVIIVQDRRAGVDRSSIRAFDQFLADRSLLVLRNRVYLPPLADQKLHDILETANIHDILVSECDFEGPGLIEDIRSDEHFPICLAELTDASDQVVKWHVRVYQGTQPLREIIFLR